MKCLLQNTFPIDHNAGNLSEILKEALIQWKLESGKQVCMTTDNGSNIICATTVRLVWTHLSCFRHNLHLTIVNCTKNEPMQKFMSTFSHS